MSDTRSNSNLPPCFDRYPGLVLEVRDGVIVSANERVERELGRRAVGESFAELLDPESSRGKWQALQAGLPGATEFDVTWELVLAGVHTLGEPRAFTALYDRESTAVLLIEQRRDPRLDRLQHEVVGVNSELADTQRQLLKQRNRLEHTLEQLEIQYRKAAELADQVQRQNEELQRSNRALDEFAHVVSHDLKAPLRSIGNHARWIEEDAAGQLNDEMREHLGRLQAAADRLKSMVDGVLAYARAGRQHSLAEEVDVEQMVREILDLVDVPANLDLQVPSPLPVLLTERVPLHQVLLNLLVNATTHVNPDAPRIRLEARDAGDFVEISIVDNGPGVEPEARERIWNLFETGGSALVGGTGIGLAVTRRLVELQGGRAWVDSAPGEGASFSFSWPKELRATV